MKAQLQYRVDPAARVALQRLEPVDILRVQNQRLLADGVGARAQRVAHMRFVKVIRRGDSDIVQPPPGPALRVHPGVELLEFGKEFRLGKMAVEDANGIVDVHRRDEIPADVADGLHMTRSDIAGRSD